jgi:GNAT superfamily N-acetyltransferase
VTELASIRKATKADLAAILALYAEVGDTESLHLGEAERILDRMARYPDYAVYVAQCEGEIVGTFALLIMDNLAHCGAPSGVVEDVVVHPCWQGQGIGKAMMRFAMRKCAEAGCYKLVLSSNVVREPAHRFYESLGFGVHGYSFQIDVEEV